MFGCCARWEEYRGHYLSQLNDVPLSKCLCCLKSWSDDTTPILPESVTWSFRTTCSVSSSECNEVLGEICNC